MYGNVNDDLRNKYFVKREENGTYVDITTMFDGVRILKVDGFLKRGAPKNIYTSDWEFSDKEDFVITTERSEYEPIIKRQRVDLEITFIVGDRYADNEIDVMEMHEAFVDYMTDKDIWVKSAYVNNRSVHCVCNNEYEPTVVKLKRNGSSYVMGTIKLHTLDIVNESGGGGVTEYDLYIGFGGATISSMQDIENLTNMQHHEQSALYGNYRISARETSYLWICANTDITRATSSGFYIPLEEPITIGELKCYRSANDIVQGEVVFTIEK